MSNTPQHSTDTPARLLLKVEEAARLLNMGRSTAYQMIASGDLPIVRIGRSVRIPVAGLQKWIDDRTETKN